MLLLIVGFVGNATAQQQYIGNAFTSAAVAPGAPAGSYSISNIENVSLSNGNLNISLPLLQIGGRGTAGYTMMLPIEYKWAIQHAYYPTGGGQNAPWAHHYFPYENWTGNSPDFIRYSPGAMRMQRASDVTGDCLTPNLAVSGRVLSRITFSGPDGTQLEFYDDRTKGKPAYFGNCSALPDAAFRGNVWVTSGSGVTFIADSVYTEIVAPGDDLERLPSGVMLFPNGNRYRIDLGKVSYIVDRNGNKVSFVYGGASGGNVNNLASITDSLGRVTTISYGQTDTAPDIITFKGSNGTPRTIEVGRNLMGNLLRTGQTLKSTQELFPGLVPDVNNNDVRNPRRVAYVKLPDGRQYNFKYSSYSDIARIEFPTGGAVEYDWDGYVPVPQIERWVTERREYPNGETGTNYQLKTKYEYFHTDPELNGRPFGNTKVTQFASTANGDSTLAVSKHYFIRDFSLIGDMFSFNDGTFGTEYQTEIYNADGTTLINKVFNEYEFRQTYTHTVPVGGWSQYSYNRVDHRPIRTTTTLADVTPNLVSKQEFGYDTTVLFNRQTDVYEYDFGSGQAGSFKRRQHTDYLTINPNQGNASYLDNSIYLRNLPSQTWVSSDINGANKVSLTQMEYDNYTVNPLVPRTNIIGHDTANYGMSKTIRGSVTKTTTYSDVNNSNTAIWIKAQYDILGNAVKTIDANGNPTTIDYADRFGSSDGEARSNTLTTELGGLSTFAFPTSATNALNWVLGYSQFDYYTGASVNTEDINGVISKTIYSDLLDRPTQSATAIGTAFERQSNVHYYDAVTERRVEVNSDLNALNDNLIKSVSFYDGLGRTIESRRFEADGGYVATKSIPFAVVLDTEIQIQRVATQVSNPYRPLAGEQPVWTTSLSDSLGRGIKTITPDGAIVKTEYSGNTITVTDQAGKKRRSVTNALGQLMRVDEPNDAGQLDVSGTPVQPTNYSYDVLNNLLQVQQIGTTTQQCGGSTSNCTQTRTFVYDSLSRLKQATNPESGIISYGYDNNGNLANKTDARSVQTAYTYDYLNRVLTRSYSGEPSEQTATPNVTYTYDNLTNAKGKLIKVDNGFSKTEYTQFDLLGRVTKSKQTTDGTSYGSEMEYVYNLSGAMIEETYPSTRKVKNVLDNNGNLSIVQSKKNSNYGYWNYAKHFTYTAAGAVSSMQLGNFKWESTVFNSRLQPTQIALGTTQAATDLLKLNYDYGSTANNGNIQSQIITVPTVANNPGFTAVQNYTYDSLNRLKQADEKPSGYTQADCNANPTKCWKQTFTFDRYGNRNFDQLNTTETLTFVKNCLNAENQKIVCENEVAKYNPTVNTANNRLNGYTFDSSGNTTKDAQLRKFTYDAENKQIKVETVNSGGTVTGTLGEYFYDGDGKRVKKVSATETTIFVYDASGKMVAEYSTQPATTPQVSYLTTDHLGSPRINTDANGAVTARHDYQPFGEEIATSQRIAGLGYTTDNIRQKFTGYERDEETDLDFAEARMFGSSIGRFTSPDPLTRSMKVWSPQSFNRYSYVGNNPTNFVDPSGLCRVNGGEDDGKPCADFSGQIYTNPNGGFSNYACDGCTAYTGGTLLTVIGGMNVQITSGGWTTLGAAASSIAETVTVEAGYGVLEDSIITTGETAIQTVVTPRTIIPMIGTGLSAGFIILFGTQTMGPPPRTDGCPEQGCAPPQLDIQPDTDVNKSPELADKSQNQRPNTKFKDETDKQVSDNARDRSLPGPLRKEYQREEKVRGDRNKNKDNRKKK